MFVKAFFSL